MTKRCQWDKTHGAAVAAVRYTTGERKRITQHLCQACLDSVTKNGYAEAKIVTDAS